MPREAALAASETGCSFRCVDGADKLVEPPAGLARGPTGSPRRGLLTHEVPERFKQPGLWMLDALAVRDRWQSKLLRTSAWFPWY